MAHDIDIVEPQINFVRGSANDSKDPPALMYFGEGEKEGATTLSMGFIIPGIHSLVFQAIHIFID